jgi:CRISPR-associated endonuclease/helicase Cas3
LADRLADLALKHQDSGQAILIYARKVEDVEKIVKRLPKSATCQITGTMRGLERDGLVKRREFRRFLPRHDEANESQQTVYLVCTSAGEVGINISADHLVSDLVPFDSMAQRLGRVNRFGNGNAIVDIVHPDSFGEEEYDARREKTLRLLRRLQGNGSPEALGALPSTERIAAYSPQPEALPISDILFDAWSLTTVDEPMPGRPPVADYLHGISQWQLPDTFVAWRHEVQEVAGDWLESYPAKQLLEDYPLKPHELLRDRYDRIFKHIERLAEGHPEDPVWIVDDDEVEVIPLAELAVRVKESIADKTLVLSPNAGGLTPGGTLGEAEGGPHLDVADEWYLDVEIKRRRRIRVWNNPSEVDPAMRLIRMVDLTPPADAMIDGDAPKRQWLWYVLPRSADDDGSRLSLQEQELTPHNRQVCDVVSKFASKLGLADDIAEQLITAGAHHDDGKDRRIWQISIGNLTDRILAKSGNKRPPEVQTPYRHEFGSLMDMHQAKPANDLALHATAAHHGRGRPHFPRGAIFDPKYHDEVAAAVARLVPLRFAALQQEYGRWGLAYLESLIRAADAWTSANPQEAKT